MKTTRNILLVARRHHPAVPVRLLLAVASLFFPALPVPAQLINLHFGGNAYTGTTETSPATPTGPAGTWNNYTSTAQADEDSTVTYANGSAGPTLSFDHGRGGTWNSTGLTASTVDYTNAGGVYDVANLYESGFINTGNNTLGLRLKGLAAGTYEVHLVPLFRGAQAAGAKADPAVRFSIGTGNDTDARGSGDFTIATIANPTQNIDTRLTTWTAATDGSTAYNYITATVTIDSPNRWLTILFEDSATSGPDRPGPCVIQIKPAGCDSPNITTGPADQTVNLNSPATLSITATGTSPTYQWQISTDNGGSWNNVSGGTGANATTYITPALTAPDSGSKYRCLEYVACTNAYATSRVATVTVQDTSGHQFRSATSGNWNSASTWEQNDGGGWVAASSTPSSGNSTITVRAGHTVTVSSPVTVDDVVIEATGVVAVSGAALTIADGAAATDCAVLGSLLVTNTGSISNAGSASLVFENGGRFVWARTSAAAAIPGATWADGSTCEIQATAGTPTGLGQSFFNFIWNYPANTSSVDLGGLLTTIRGDFSVHAPNSPTAGTMKLYNSAAGAGVTLNINGNVNLNQGYLNLMGGSASNSSITLNVGGDFRIATGATLDLRNSGAGSAAYIVFTNTSATQTLTNGGNITHSGGAGINKIVWVVNEGSTLNVGPGSLMVRTNDYITGGGTLTVNASGGLEGEGTNRLTSALGTIYYGGTLTLGSLPAFAGGESFLLFDATNRFNSFAAYAPATPGTNLVWDTTQLVGSGILAVATSSGGDSAGRFDSVVISGSDLIFSGSGGTPNAGYSVIASTNISLPRAAWPVRGSGQFDGGGNFTYTNTITPGTPRLFYGTRVP